MGDGRGSSAIIATMLLFCMLVMFQSEITDATIWTVGDEAGWGRNVNRWPFHPRDKHFVNGDKFVFKYDPKLYNVVKVKDIGYYNCNGDGTIAVYRTGNDTIMLPTGLHYFVCTTSNNCKELEMSVALQVDDK